jgi:MFS family permease
MRGERLGRPYGYLLVASVISAIGDGVLLTAGPLLMLSLTSDPRLIAAAQVAVTLPFILLGMVGGVAVDRMDRRRLMSALHLVRSVVLVVLVLAIWAGFGQIPLLLAGLFLLSSGDTVFRTASQAVVPSIVTTDNLVAATGRLITGEVLGTNFIGPAVGGFLFAGAVALPFLVDSASFVIAGVLVLLALPASLAARPTEGGVAQLPRHAGILADSMAGFRWLWANATLRFLAGSSAVINLFTAATTAVLVIYARRILHLGAIGFGVLEACAAIGGIVAGLLAARIARRVGTRNSLAIAALLQGLGQLTLALGRDRVLTVVALASAGFAAVLFSAVSIALRQTLIPDEFRGRVTSVYRMLAWGSLPIGAFAAGLMVDSLGLRSVYAVGTVCMAALFALILLKAHAYGLPGRQLAGAGQS